MKTLRIICVVLTLLISITLFNFKATDATSVTITGKGRTESTFENGVWKIVCNPVTDKTCTISSED